jgi:hypothetical protein
MLCEMGLGMSAGEREKKVRHLLGAGGGVADVE